jgi:hypothetical protein
VLSAEAVAASTGTLNGDQDFSQVPSDTRDWSLFTRDWSLFTRDKSPVARDCSLFADQPIDLKRRFGPEFESMKFEKTAATNLPVDNRCWDPPSTVTVARFQCAGDRRGGRGDGSNDIPEYPVPHAVSAVLVTWPFGLRGLPGPQATALLGRLHAANLPSAG